LFGEASIIASPIFFHDAVIGCLEAEVDARGNGRLNLERVANLEAIANLISPAVQTYREMSALNTLSQDLAHRQIKTEEFNLETDIRLIARSIFDVVSPSVLGLSIDAGFSRYQTVYPPDRQLETVDIPETRETSEDPLTTNGKYRLLEMSIAKGPQPGDPLFGGLILGIEKGRQRTRHSTIGTNPTCRRALSNLVADAMLDFMRGHLNQLTDRLGVRLSGPEATLPSGWLDQIETTAQEAKLPWAVASYSYQHGFDPQSSKTFGQAEMVEMVAFAERPDQKGKWKRIDKEKQLWLYEFDKPNVTSHIIRQTLIESQHHLQRDYPNSSATLWLGVSRPGFGNELEYVSPWRYFIDRFCEIADSALLRILIMEDRNTLVAEVQNLLAGAIIFPFLTHQLSNLANEAGLLAQGLRNLSHANVEHTLNRLDYVKDQFDELLKLSAGSIKLIPERPCSLAAAIRQADELVSDSLKKDRVTMVIGTLPSNAMIDIPLQAAANTIAIIIDNGRNAIRTARQHERQPDRPGRIDIVVTEEKEKNVFLCDVTDNGIGLPAYFPDPPFKDIQGDKPNGHGVGLYCSTLLLRLFGGDIAPLHRQRTPPTTFRISFPKWCEQEQAD
jgi:hypothetical protein